MAPCERQVDDIIVLEFNLFHISSLQRKYDKQRENETQRTERKKENQSQTNQKPLQSILW